MKPYLHAKNSAKKYGGVVDDYAAIHEFLDSSKAHIADHRHRALLHSTFGCFIVEKVFGAVATNSEGKEYSPRDIAEQHCLEDLGTIPTVQDWLGKLPLEKWMGGGFPEKVGSRSAIEQYKDAKSRANAILSEASKGIGEELAKVFETTPFERVRWKQYTPYFNDGDECEFRALEPEVILPPSDKKKADPDFDEDDYYDTDDEVYNNEDRPESEWKEGWYSGYGGYSHKEDYKVVASAISELGDDILERAFGDHVQVTWVRGQGVTTEEYDHE